MSALSDLFTGIAAAIREKSGETATMKPAEFPEKILGIEGNSSDVCYVTFMSYDGTVEYGKKAVAVGDNCANPIDRGVFDTPTRESDVQYNYTFAGWSTEANGGLDSTALLTVDADRTVYANFIAVVRYYTVTYYDDDGATVLKTESLAYGSTPNYTPEKDDYGFEGWTPALATVTGDASYTANWTELITFANASWAKIAEISAAGEAANTFAVGDEKTVPITYADGTTDTLTVAIAGFGIDDLSNGSKAGITIVTKTVPNYSIPWVSTYGSSNRYDGSLVHAALMRGGDIWNMLPSELTAVIKYAAKKYDASCNSGASPTLNTIYSPLWALSTYELGQSTTAATSAQAPGSQYVSVLGSRYPLYPIIDMTGASVEVDSPYVQTSAGETGSAWTRTLQRLGVWAVCAVGAYSNASKTQNYVTLSRTQDSALATTNKYVLFGFCV